MSQPPRPPFGEAQIKPHAAPTVHLRDCFAAAGKRLEMISSSVLKFSRKPPTPLVPETAAANHFASTPGFFLSGIARRLRYGRLRSTHVVVISVALTTARESLFPCHSPGPVAMAEGIPFGSLVVDVNPLSLCPFSRGMLDRHGKWKRFLCTIVC